MDQFLRCGDLHYGFARVYCRSCRHSFLRPISCGSRNFFPSCEAKRRALWVEHVVEDILPGAIPSRMIVFTMPKSLRAMFMRERSLLGDAARLTYHCTLRFFQELFLKHLQIWDPPTGPPFEPEVKETVYDYTFFDDVPPDGLTD